MIQNEWRFQAAAYAFLRKALPPDALVWSTDHAGKRSVVAGARMKQRGIVPGIPDMFVLWGGALVGIELKAGKNAATYGQIGFGGLMAIAGGYWFVASSLEEVEAGLHQRGIPLRATTLTAQERDALLAAPRITKPRARTQKPTTARVRRVQAIIDGLHAREPVDTSAKR